MFVIDRTRELVGFSAWPWDSVYSAVVGCYRDGRLVAYAECREPAQAVGLEGPTQRCWFRMTVDPEIRAALEDRDPSVRLMRMEDGHEVAFAGADGAATAQTAHRLEQLLSRASRRAVRLDGFAAYLAAPLAHQIDMLFLDIFNRRADPDGSHHYANELEQGRSIFAIRSTFMASDEFRNRGITVSDRVGALLTSPIWHLLARADAPGTRRTPLRTVRLARYAGMSELEFATAIHIDVHGDAPTEVAQAALASVAAEHGRMLVASLLVRDAADGGVLLGIAGE